MTCDLTQQVIAKRKPKAKKPHKSRKKQRPHRLRVDPTADARLLECAKRGVILNDYGAADVDAGYPARRVVMNL